MTVRELIIALVDFQMDAEVRLCTQESAFSEQYAFKIDEVENWHGLACLNFTDWREADDNQTTE